jgi:hypothetical protein
MADRLRQSQRRILCANRVVTARRQAGSDDARNAPAINGLTQAGASDDPK